MKFRSYLTAKYLTLSLLLALALMFGLSELVARVGGENAAEELMWPGRIVCGLTGFDDHDVVSLLVFFLGNVLFYWGIVFFLLSWSLTYRTKNGTKIPHQ
ncbi:MAG TPA: hypothetical protein VJN69_08555 [Candidatus Acidoferrales bacterium]|nr:hypothetical protein [Candidatus Acidoferrales bacterium]